MVLSVEHKENHSRQKLRKSEHRKSGVAPATRHGHPEQKLVKSHFPGVRFRPYRIVSVTLVAVAQNHIVHCQLFLPGKQQSFPDVVQRVYQRCLSEWPCSLCRTSVKRISFATVFQNVNIAQTCELELPPLVLASTGKSSAAGFLCKLGTSAPDRINRSLR